MSALAEKIRACAEQGMSQKQTAQALKKNRCQIRFIQRREGIVLPFGRKTGPTPIVDADVARKLAGDGLTMDEAAKKLGVHKETIRRAAQRHGVTFARRPYEHPVVERYRKCAKAGMTVQQIAKKFGVSVSSVHGTVKRNGIVLKPSDHFDRRMWTPAQIDILRQQYGSASTHELESAIGRSLSAIQKKAHQLGIRRDGLPTGTVLFKVDPAHLAWLKAETPEGATLADTIRAIITDAYLDAQEARA